MTPVSSITFERTLFDLGVNYGVATVADLSWRLPSEVWIGGALAVKARAYLLRKGLLPYAPESNDCDDYADEVKRLAKRMHAWTIRKGLAPSGTALAFGSFWYQSPGGPHAINAALCRESAQFKLVFFEPQTQRIISLTRKEINSCYAASF